MSKKSGQSLVENLLICALVSVVAITVLGDFGNQINNSYSGITDSLNNSIAIASTTAIDNNNPSSP